MHFRWFLQAALILLLSSCASGRSNSNVDDVLRAVARGDAAVDPIRLDLGDVEHFHACSAKPRRSLSPSERCIIDTYRKRCGRAEDCYVTCLSSPDSTKSPESCPQACGVVQDFPSKCNEADHESASP